MTTTGTSPSPLLGSGAIDNRYAPNAGQLSPPPATPPVLPQIPNPQQVANQPTTNGIPQSVINMLPPQFGQQLANLPAQLQGVDLPAQLQQMIAAHRQSYQSPLDRMIGQRQYMSGQTQTRPMSGLANTLGIRRR